MILTSLIVSFLTLLEITPGAYGETICGKHCDNGVLSAIGSFLFGYAPCTGTCGVCAPSNTLVYYSGNPLNVCNKCYPGKKTCADNMACRLSADRSYYSCFPGQCNRKGDCPGRQSCLNGGTSDAVCVVCQDDSDCPKTKRYCSNPGTANAVCTNCKGDSDCPSTARYCANPGSPTANCYDCQKDSDCSTGICSRFGYCPIIAAAWFRLVPLRVKIIGSNIAGTCPKNGTGEGRDDDRAGFGLPSGA
ncbi:hypothetical protein B0H13DRAFT_1884596 [Mycena leptocephala]|nr:hypothetical protein B0H13DRAFT_1884596 [Mycena leptocephala]